MKKAMSQLKSIAVTRAARFSRVSGLSVSRKQPIGFLDGDLIAVGDCVIDALANTLAKAELDAAEVVTIYYQGDTERSEVEPFISSLREQYSQLQIELVRGGQPHYNYIASVE